MTARRATARTTCEASAAWRSTRRSASPTSSRSCTRASRACRSAHRARSAPPSRERTGLVYRGVRGVTRVVGSGLDGVLGRLAPLLDDVADTPARDQLVAALNGVLGDYLARSGNPLAIPLAPAPWTARRSCSSANALSAAFPHPRSTVVVAVHGLCMNDRQWTRKGHDHGVALARDLDATLLRLHYNSGRHVHETGRDFAAALDALVDAWPVPIDAPAPARPQHGRARRAQRGARGRRGQPALAQRRSRRSPASARRISAPPLERGGHGIDVLLDKLPYTAPFARLGRVRSAGITDLRHGSVIEDDRRRARATVGQGRKAGQGRLARGRRLLRDRREPRPGAGRHRRDDPRRRTGAGRERAGDRRRRGRRARVPGSASMDRPRDRAPRPARLRGGVRAPARLDRRGGSREKV